MLSLLDIAERTQKGPKMDVNDWNMGLFRKMNELVKRYDIVADAGGSWFNLDPGIEDRVFQAGLDFLTEMGIYCVTTGRIVQFSAEEVRQAIAEIPRSIIVGADRDTRVIESQPVETKKMVALRPGHHSPFNEEVAPLVVKNFAQIPEGTYLEGFNFTHTDGREIYGLPMEVYGARRELAWLREGIRKAGRPGMALAYYPIATRAAALIAPIDPDYGLRRTDGLLLSTLPDMQMEVDLLAAAIVYNDYGCFRLNGGGTAQMGSFCGGIEGAMIESVAKPIAGWMVYRDQFSYAGVGEIGSTTKKIVDINPLINWASSVVIQSLGRHTGMIRFQGVDTMSGPGSLGRLVMVAIAGIRAPINGANLCATRFGRARMNTGQTPLETELLVDVVRASQKAGLNRQNAGAVLNKLAAMLNGKPPEPAQDIREIYDLVHHRPLPDYAAKYTQMVEELARIEVPLT
ncbi:MAG: monomethylamine:corrinoid methyltransferase [Bacteroidetes bacterium]|nr:monomethylamine:corrinoid methyltransferase [Bacteroidota bacterium]MCL5027345.1 monomethylamine:corrinoid methyltransferase [Chloroflexota bacterium]